ncbi:MAG: hypothetical protein LM590_14495 [Thermofilum sp.]|jgi:energy-coupling factor transporter ATP-binding protein EcfA2|nr:hypothetical protein [Thermofilum sp.]
MEPLNVYGSESNATLSQNPLSETSWTEKLLAIHATLKLAYSPYPPFFLIDEAALSLDETRKKAVFNYLLHLAKENGWFVILTELGNESEITVSPFKGL